jgi:hypothetical protein
MVRENTMRVPAFEKLSILTWSTYWLISYRVGFPKTSRLTKFFQDNRLEIQNITD